MRIYLLLCLNVLALQSPTGLCASYKECKNICGNFQETKNARQRILTNYRVLKNHRVNRSADDERKRIVNGYEVTDGRGFLALIKVWQLKVRCVGSIINDRFILTAGHCVCTKRFKDDLYCEDGKITYDVSKLKVYVGIEVNEDHTQILEGHIKERDVEQVIVHPEWTSQEFNREDGFVDIALLKLKDKLEFGANISPICLPPLDKKVKLSETGYTAGWGENTWRKQCFTDNRGPARNVPCLGSWSYGGKSHTNCFHGNSPADENTKCVKFRQANENFNWNDTTYVVIRYNGGKKKSKCFSETPDYGWCGVRAQGKQEQTIGLSRGGEKYIVKGDNWGFCSKLCESSLVEGMLESTLMETQLTQLSTEDCELYNSVNPNLGFNKDKEMCAGMKHKFPNVKHYVRSLAGKEKDQHGNEGNKYSHKLTHTRKARLNTKKELWKKLDYYLGFSDTCGGDSGSAFFQIGKKDKKFYLTGVLSRGAEECALMNVPAIYTSLQKKSIMKWIIKNSKEGSC